MTAARRRAALGAAAVAAAAFAVGACGETRKRGGGGGPPPANEAVVAPYGFKIEITGVDVPADPTAAATPPTVTFRVTDADGAPILGLKEELARAPSGQTPATGHPHVNAPRFTLARLEPDDAYRSLYMNPANTQATSVTLPRDPAQFDARVTSNGNGSYTFKLDPLSANPTAEERRRTHTVGVWASRFPSEQVGEDQAASSTLDFVPAGGAAAARQVVSLQACNTCHGPAVRAHGTRLGTRLCLTCHTSQTSDPDTGNSVEFRELIHKIHYGGDRPGETYRIVGFGGREFRFDQPWMNDVRDCTICHQGADADRHLARPSERSCTTCHTIVQFDASAGSACSPDRKDASDCNHPVQVAPGTACSTCHTQDAIRSQHVSIFEIARRFQYDLQSVTVGGDRKPVARFAVRDAQTNQPRDLENDPAYRDPQSSLNVQFGWPSKEHTNQGASTTAPGQPRSVAIVRGGLFDPADAVTVTKVAGQPGVYEVASPVALPEGVTGGTVFMDGHPVIAGENVPVVNATRTFGAAGGAGDARRQVVSVDRCNACHGVVSAHGRNRNGSIETCVVCHNPRATDWQKRQGTEGAAAEQSVDFKVLIHGVHSADIRDEPMIVYGFNPARAGTGGAPGIPHEFPGEIPHGVANCAMCHAATTFMPPLPAEALDTTVATNGTPAEPADDTTLGKTQAVCLSCHDRVRFAQAEQALPSCNTIVPANSAACLHSAGAQAEAACASCHGSGGAADTARVHGVR
ncbi:MAG TPA: OmcA/MtrC family decaheme c-type cytochrome [Anaeromyxobacter sp.]|nr:OmcA/MtrC family decaheme c-type cytochrome [Anaeromyxobacter sp.]